MKDYLNQLLEKRINQMFARADGLHRGVIIPLDVWDHEDYWTQEAIYNVNVQNEIVKSNLYG